MPEERRSSARDGVRTVGVTRHLGEVRAVHDVTVAFQPGEIHAVCGENGAGKTSLLKIVAGMITPDQGEVLVGNGRLAPHTPAEAIARGVAMVLQHFALVPAFTALENIIMGSEPTDRFGILDVRAARARIETIMKDLGTSLPLDERVEDLGVGDRQRIEIARTLYRDAELVILDEPTAVLTKTEAAALYATMRRLAESGKGIVVVTHKMDEVRAYADVVTVLRRGELVFTRRLDRSGDIAAQVDEVTQAIMGSVPVSNGGLGSYRVEPVRAAKLSTQGPGDVAKDAPVVLAFEDVHIGRALHGLSLTVRAGEIVGMAGIEGNGQREIVGILAGELAVEKGSVTRGTVALVHEDRQHEGLVLDASLRDNIMLGELGSFANAIGWLDLEGLEQEAGARLERSGAPNDLDRAARTLSGGNQQKIVVTRALARPASAVVVAQPTRGVDLAAAVAIHSDLLAAAKAGAGVLVMSVDLDELRTLAARILVIARGRIVAELPNTASDDEIGRHMLDVGAREISPDA